MSRRDPELTTAQVTPISRQELQAKMGAGAVILIDAQADGWYEREHLPGALRSGVHAVDELAATLSDDRSAEIVVYCWSETCDASARVSTDLARRGYTNVRRYVEGKRDWLEAGLPIDSGGPSAGGPAEPSSAAHEGGQP